MNIVVAIDSFKGSLTSLEAGDTAKRGILAVFPTAKVDVRPLADGGEGTVEALVVGMGGEMQVVEVAGPLGETVQAKYGVLPDGKTAIMEMAAASGITLVPPENRNPLNTTTYGVGEIIVDAISRGCRRFIVGIGGSSTNDGGIGMLQALGFRLLDVAGKDVPRGALGLKELATIDASDVLPELDECVFRVACDVTNPLCGKKGCSVVFGSQKGATTADVSRMDKWLAKYAELSSQSGFTTNPDEPGAGAAGGLGFAFRTFTNAKLESGVNIVLAETRLEDYVKEADLVITGEGRLDGQTVMGKAPIGVAKIAKKYGKTVIAFAGCVSSDAKICNEHGIDAFFPILRSTMTLEEALELETAKQNMVATVEQAMRLISIGWIFQ